MLWRTIETNTVNNRNYEAWVNNEKYQRLKRNMKLHRGEDNYVFRVLVLLYDTTFTGEAAQYIRYNNTNVILNVLLDIDNYVHSCLLNYYRNGADNVGWHYDKKVRDLHQFVVTVSLGCSRIFKFRLKEDNSIKREVLLQSGDLLLMCGNTQKLWEHTIPKVVISKCNSGRISLAYRMI